MPDPEPIPQRLLDRAVWVIALGLYLSFHGYHSRDGDQAYRLPLLVHYQDSTLFSHDPFVCSFTAFNPHRGYLLLLDWASRPFGLSVGLAALFASTFAATCSGLDRLTRAVWPDSGRWVGLIAVGLALMAKAGNIGTNHLFEATLLDRLIALALGWWALADVIARPDRGIWRSSIAIGLAMLVHPSLGLQLGLLLGGSWVAWTIGQRLTGVGSRAAMLGLIALAAALTPPLALMAGQGRALFQGLDPEEFRTLVASIQGPQHMLPHLWRFPQWLAWTCYPTLALLSLGKPPWPAARARLVIVLAVTLIGLAAGGLAIEGFGDLRITLLQPFRMATVARGLCLVLVADRVRTLWKSGTWPGRARAALIAAGLVGDWAFVVASAVELAASATERWGPRAVSLWITLWCRRPACSDPQAGRLHHNGGVRSPSESCARAVGWIGSIVLILGIVYLVRHDPESGYWPILGALVAIGPAAWWLASRADRLTRDRIVRGAALAWLIPISAWVAAWVPGAERTRLAPLIDHCRFTEVPTHDIERLAVWCREHTPRAARFIGPPGPKSFRLWSLRALAFNRAGSPYHASGLADWADRFRAHVDFRGTTLEFARAYLADRQGLERRYQQLSDADRADLARRQGAAFVIASPPPNPRKIARDGPLELLHIEGRYAVYRVRDRSQPVQARPSALASAGTG